MLVDFHDKGVGIPDAMCTDSEGRLWRAGLFGATIVLVRPSHRRAVGQHRVPSPSHDVVLLLGGRGRRGRSPSHDIMLLQGSRLQWMFVTNTALKFHLLNETCLCRWADGLLPLNKIMVFTVLEVSRQAILLSVVVVSAHRFNAIKQP